MMVHFLTSQAALPEQGRTFLRIKGCKMATPINTANGPLKKEQVRHLAFEGGGGKGFAFVGALMALENPLGILSYASQPLSPYVDVYKPDWLPHGVDQSRRLVGQIKGVSGASAGAITAFLLSCGYSPAEIVAIMDNYDFNQFFEPADPRMVPMLSLDVTSSDPSGGEVRATKDSSSESADSLALKKQVLLSAAIALTPAGAGAAAIAKLGAAAIAELWERLLRVAPDLLQIYATLTGTTGLFPIQMLLKHLDKYLAYLPEDMGLFPGYQARRFFAEALAAKFPSSTGRPNFNVMFKSHYDFFGVKLAVTGTNLETGKSEIFSVDTTPYFPVADAVRISMGLPLVYKPLVIRTEELKGLLPSWVAGVWVDGGYLSNLPITAFDRNREATAQPDTLGLRLEEDQRVEIRTFSDFLKVWPIGFGFMGTGESVISESWGHTSQSIALDTTGLSLLNFKPDPKARQAVVSRAHEATLKYFGAEKVEMEPQPIQIPGRGASGKP
jgi:predicted acylesterase/phospholipase RssA